MSWAAYIPILSSAGGRKASVANRCIRQDQAIQARTPTEAWDWGPGWNSLQILQSDSRLKRSKVEEAGTSHMGFCSKVSAMFCNTAAPHKKHRERMQHDGCRARNKPDICLVDTGLIWSLHSHPICSRGTVTDPKSASGV